MAPLYGGSLALCCSVSQFFCIVLQYVAEGHGVQESCIWLCCTVVVFVVLPSVAMRCSVLQRVAACCSVLQCVAMSCIVDLALLYGGSHALCCSVLQCVEVRCRMLQCSAACYSVLQCVAVCCSVLQCHEVRKG